MSVLSLSDLDLPHLAMETPEFAADPFPHFEAARGKHPWLATSAFGHVVTEYRAMKELFIQDDKLRYCMDQTVELMGAKETAFGRWALQQIMSAPPERHKQLREIYAPAFTPRHANELRPLIRATITRLLDEWAPRGAFDFDEFASWFPISAMFAILGAPAEQIGAIKSDLETIGLAFSLNSELVPLIDKAVMRQESFVAELIAYRRTNPPDPGDPDFLGALVSAHDAGAISEEELVADVMDFIGASYDTTKNMLAFIMRLLIDRPEMYRRCADDADYRRRVVEEALRHSSTSTAVRLTTEDVLYRDVLIPKNTMLFFPFSISGRDPGSFPEGDIFDPDRPVDPERRHIAFGLGRHFCIGQYIARVEMQEALHLIAQRVHDPRLNGEIEWRPFPGIWGMKSLPISFTPG